MISIFSFQFILRRLENINAPTETKAIDVHGVYTVPLTLIPAKTLKTGNIAKLKKNNKPVVIAAIPVLAPLSTPTVDSANELSSETAGIYKRYGTGISICAKMESRYGKPSLFTELSDPRKKIS